MSNKKAPKGESDSCRLRLDKPASSVSTLRAALLPLLSEPELINDHLVPSFAVSSTTVSTVGIKLAEDDKPNRIRRGPGADKFAPIREAFEKFSSLCRSKFVCDYSLTIDEQLMPCKSRCSFVTYMPNKPDKYEIKFWVLVDVKSKYVSNIFPSLGAQEKEQRGDTPLAESVVMRLTEGVRGKGYNIICDNFFTSLPLALKLQKEKISIVGTIRKNRREIAKKMTDAVKGNLHCS